MTDYFDGYDTGLDAGWGAGKTKAYQEVLNRWPTRLTAPIAVAGPVW